MGEAISAVLLARRRVGVLVAALRAHRPLVHRRGASARAPTSSTAAASARASWSLQAAAGAVHDHRERRPHRPVAERRAGADRLQDRRAADRRRDRNAVAVQLPLEGAIARDGSFEGLSGGAAAPVEYWRLPGGDPARIRTPIYGDDPRALIDKVLRRGRGDGRSVRRSATPYLAVPVPSYGRAFPTTPISNALDEVGGRGREA